MSPQQLDMVLGHVGPLVQKKNTVRESIDARQRLAICIRYLATGESYRSLAAQYRVGVTTVSNIVPEVCDAIWVSMNQAFMAVPASEEDWRFIAMNFAQRWDYPNCIGALDGKHVVIQAPPNSGSLYYNYRCSFSVVLMALVDAFYKFICIDIGSYGHHSGGGIFSNSSLGIALSNSKSLKLPNDCVLECAGELGAMPYIVVGDEAFPLQRHLMRPYPGKHATPSQEIYNYRHSRARRIVENGFGILASRWRVYHTKIAVFPDTVNKIVQATTVLHNMIQRDSTPRSVRELLQDSRPDNVEGLHGLRKMGSRGTTEAIDIRNNFARYFEENPLPWQTRHVQRGPNDI